MELKKREALSSAAACACAHVLRHSRQTGDGQKTEEEEEEEEVVIVCLLLSNNSSRVD